LVAAGVLIPTMSVECDEDEATFNAKLREVAKHKPKDEAPNCMPG